MGVLRRTLILALLIGIFVSGLSISILSIRNRTTQLRGWADPATDSALPFHTAQQAINTDLTQYAPDAIRTEFEAIRDANFTWLRQPIRWSEIEPERGVYRWDHYDLIFRNPDLTGLRWVAVLDETPRWARRPFAEGSRYSPPSSPADFAQFVAQVAQRYGSVIDYYQIWDEPNLSEHWGGVAVRPTDYVALLQAVYPALKGADQNAFVIAAGLAPTTESGPMNLNEVDYLTAMYAAGAKEVMDAVSGKPYGFDRSPLDRTVNPNVLNFSRIILLREVMEAQGDAETPIFASHFGWNSLPEGWKGAPSIWGQVNAATQAIYTRESYERAAQEWTWLMALTLEHWQPNAPADDPIQGFAVREKVQGWGWMPRMVGNAPLPIGLHPATHPQIRYIGEWRFGELGADVGINSDKSDSTFSLEFIGESIGLRVRRADYVAYLYVEVDGQPANALPRDGTGQSFILLTSPNRQPITETIVVARNLPYGTHTLKVRAYLGYERWAIAGIGIGKGRLVEHDPLIAGGIITALIGLIGMGWIVRGYAWDRLRSPSAGLWAYLKRMSDLFAGIIVTAMTGIGMFLTFGGAIPNLFRRDEPAVLLTVFTAGLAYFSPGLIFTIIAFGVLFILIFNKPALGIGLVAFFAPFFLYPVQNYLRALPMVEVVLVLTVAAVIARVILIREWRPGRLRALDWAMIAFAGLATLALTWSEQRAPALREWRIMVIEPILLYALIRIIRFERTDALRTVDSLLFGGLVVCTLGLVDYFLIGRGVAVAEGGVRRLGSVYGSPNNVALFIGRCAPFVLAMVLFRTSPLRRGIAVGVLAILLGALLLTQSAGALLLGIPVAFGVVALVWDWKRGTVLILLGVIALGIGAVLFLPRLQSAFGGGRESSLARVNLWTSTFNLLSERPLTGAGLDQFLYMYRSRYILPDAYKEPDLSHPHNIFLDFWVRLGIGGTVLIIVIQGVYWGGLLRALRAARLRSDLGAVILIAGLMGSMADTLAHGLVDNSYFVVDLAYIFCLSLGLQTLMVRETTER
jgi:O-antigen ligase